MRAHIFCFCKVVSKKDLDLVDTAQKIEGVLDTINGILSGSKKSVRTIPEVLQQKLLLDNSVEVGEQLRRAAALSKRELIGEVSAKIKSSASSVQVQ